MLKIGRIGYANCTPLFLALQKHFYNPGYCFIHGVPAKLNIMLRNGEIDVCPSSSIEYALHPELYKILPGLSISSCGSVKSVLLLSSRPITDLNDCTICLSTESATSVNLLKILLQQHIGISCKYIKGDQVDSFHYQGILLIGDEALKQSLSNNWEYQYDLGEIWYNWTSLPFVFALWLCNNSKIKDNWHELCFFNEKLNQAKKIAEKEYDRYAEISPESVWMGKENLILYWHQNISYDLSQKHISGLLLFYEKLYSMNLIPNVPELQFLNSQTVTE